MQGDLLSRLRRLVDDDIGDASHAFFLEVADGLEEALKRMTEAEHKLLDYQGKPMLFSQRQRLRELEELRGQYEAACWDRTTLIKRRDELEEENAALRAARESALVQPINVTVDHAYLEQLARAWLTELVESLEALPKQWREQAASVNDPKSPSLLVECAEQLEQALDKELPG